MMIDIVARVERGEWELRKDRREVALTQAFPKHAAPLDVVVAIKVAAANRVG